MRGRAAGRLRQAETWRGASARPTSSTSWARRSRAGGPAPRVHVVNEMPLTAVGKIFKPALQQREIEAAVRGEAQNVGATIVDLAFERSPRLGQVVRVRAGEGTEALRAALERYAFKFEVQD